MRVCIERRTYAQESVRKGGAVCWRRGVHLRREQTGSGRSCPQSPQHLPLMASGLVDTIRMVVQAPWTCVLGLLLILITKVGKRGAQLISALLSNSSPSKQDVRVVRNTLQRICIPESQKIVIFKRYQDLESYKDFKDCYLVFQVETLIIPLIVQQRLAPCSSPLGFLFQMRFISVIILCTQQWIKSNTAKWSCMCGSESEQTLPCATLYGKKWVGRPQTLRI